MPKGDLDLLARLADFSELGEGGFGSLNRDLADKLANTGSHLVRMLLSKFLRVGFCRLRNQGFIAPPDALLCQFPRRHMQIARCYKERIPFGAPGRAGGCPKCKETAQCYEFVVTGAVRASGRISPRIAPSTAARSAMGICPRP